MKRNLLAIVDSRQPLELTSILLLLLPAIAVSLPLEVAFNRVWGVPSNRSYWKNQLLSLCLILACGSLAMLSFLLTALNRQFLGGLLGLRSGAPLWFSVVFFKIAAVPVSMLG